MLANVRLALQRMTHQLRDAAASCTAALSRPVQRPNSTARYARLGLERLTERTGRIGGGVPAEARPRYSRGADWVKVV